MAFLEELTHLVLAHAQIYAHCQTPKFSSLYHAS